MRKIIDTLHDIWCAITKRCRVEADEDSYIDWLRDQEQEAINEARKSRQRRESMIERDWLSEPLSSRFSGYQPMEGDE